MFLMPDVIRSITSEYPDLCIELAPEDNMVNLLRRAADIGIRFREPDQNAIIAKKLAPRQLGFFVAHDFESSIPDEASITDHLATTSFVWEDRDDMLAQGAQQLGLPLPSNISLRTDDQTAQIGCIQAGVGAGFCQLHIAEKLGLRRLAPDWQFAAPIWVAMHEDQSKVNRIRIVFDAIVDAFKQEKH
jgi:DNA-binding transcriptional LysR family regulator